MSILYELKFNYFFVELVYYHFFTTNPTSEITYFDKELAEYFYDNKYIDYHCEFFKAGITAIIKMWLNNNCKETPEEMVQILISEYNIKTKA